MSKLREAFLNELGDIFDAEKQLVKALPKIAKSSQNPQLREAIESHLEETLRHVERIEEVFFIFFQSAKSKKCKAMQGLIEEGQDAISDDEGDAALICAAQKVEHYEIASYGSLVSRAKLLGEQDAADLLEQTLEEEKDAEEKLNNLAENIMNAEEAEGEEEHAGDRSRSR